VQVAKFDASAFCISERTSVGQLTIDPMDALAISVAAGKGMYALLIGSGVSRGAGVKTGWDITLDLVRKLPAAKDVAEKSDEELVRWYESTFKKEPNYSEILELLGKTSAERQRLLEGYFDGKHPSKAHKAIAKLVSHGFVKMIITTNFDRLIEQALSEAGVQPTVLSTPESIEGCVLLP
jgi:hypothetical protein